MTTKSVVLVTLATLALGACKDKPAAPATGPGSGSASAVTTGPAPAKIDGPSVAPTVTSGITFVTPADAGWWGELNFACYRAVMSLTGTKTPGEAFENLSPNVVPAMQAGGIDLGRDLAAFGGFDCGGSPCLYVALTLAHPERLGEVLKLLVPASPPKELGKGHFQLDTPGSSGTRTIHIRAVPIQWSAGLPTDPWSQEAARATHVIFIGGIDGKNVDVDPLTRLADATAARAKVTDAEGAVADARGRCLVGLVGPRDFLPGYKLEKARFAMAAPPSKGADPLMEMMGSQKSLGVEVELTLAPAPSQADVDGWIKMGRMYMSGIGANVRQGIPQSPLMDIYFDMISLVGERAFKPALAGKALRLSWRTDRIPQSELHALETRLQATMGAATP